MGEHDLGGDRRVARVMDVVRTVARRLIGADGVTFVLRDRDQCFYVEEDAVGPLWKGRRFPARDCVSGWVIEHGVPAVIADIYEDERVLHEAYRTTFVRSMAMIPVGRPAFGAIGAYWATRHEPTRDEIDTLIAIADSALIQVEPQAR
jgi:GAF domain-containing protein